MCIQDIFSLAKDVIVSLVAIVTACVAIKGINTWRRELVGKRELDLATRLSNKLIAVRFQIEGVRYEFLTEDEKAAVIAEFKFDLEKLNGDKRAEVISNTAFGRRNQPLRKAMSDLNSVTWETELLWEDKITKSLKPLLEKLKELFYSQALIARAEIPGHIAFTEDEKRAYGIVYIWGQTPDAVDEDPFSDEIDKIVNEIQDKLGDLAKL